MAHFDAQAPVGPLLSAYDFVKAATEAHGDAKLMHAASRVFVAVGASLPEATTHRDHARAVAAMLAAPGSDVNVASIGGRTALMDAAAGGHTEVAVALLSVPGINVNVADAEGSTALVEAASGGHTEIARALIAMPGIDVNVATDADGNTTALVAAVAGGHTEIVVALLATPGTVVHDGNLLISAIEGHTEIARALLAIIPGVDVNVATAEELGIDGGVTALMLAAGGGYTDIVVVLLAAPGIEVNTVSTGGRTALLDAIAGGHKEAAVALLAHPGTDLQGTKLTYVTEAEAEIIEAELKSSQWRFSGVPSEEGTIKVVSETMQWGPEGDEPSLGIHRSGPFIFTNGWWIVRASILEGRLMSVQWRKGTTRWCCDVAGPGCLRPTPAKADEPCACPAHRCWSFGDYSACEVCYASGTTQTPSGDDLVSSACWWTRLGGSTDQEAPTAESHAGQPGPSAADVRPPGSKRKVMVLGSTGNVGQATLYWLVQRYGSELHIQAGTRDPSRLAAMPGVEPVQATIHDPQDRWLKPLDGLILITPGNDQRVPSTIKMANAAVRAGVGHIVLVSVITADLSATVFGKQFQQIESAVKDACVQSRSKYTFARLPLFLENYYGFAASVKEQGVIACSMQPSQPYCPIAVSDIGEALAAIAAEPTGKYLNQTLPLAGESHTCHQMVEWMGDTRDAPVEYRRISSSEVRSTLLEFGFLQWQAEGIIELYDLVSAGRYVYSAETLRAVLGHDPLPVQEWLRSAAPAFKDERSARAEELAKGEGANKGESASSAVTGCPH